MFTLFVYRLNVSDCVDKDFQVFDPSQTSWLSKSTRYGTVSVL